MTDEMEISYEESNDQIPDEEMEWTHAVLNDFEMAIDALGIETVMLAAPTTAGSSASRREKAGTFGGGGGGGGGSSGGSSGGKNELRRISHLV